MLRAIDIVSIPVHDQDAALKFYTEKLGFKVATNQYFGDGKQRWIELLIPGAETRVALFTPEGHENRIGGFQPLTFRCDENSRLSLRRRCGEQWLSSKTLMAMSSYSPASSCRLQLNL